MKGSIKTELIVGIFTLVVFIVLAFMTFKVTDFQWRKKEGYIIYVHFKNISGLDEKTDFRIAGIDAGAIEKIELIDGRARLTLRVNPSVKIYSDASASIKLTGMLGDKYLSISPGIEEPILKDGDTIEDVKEMVEVDELMTSLSEASKGIQNLASSINNTLGDEDFRESLKETTANLRDITKTLKETIEDNNQKFTSILSRVDSITASLDDLIKTNRSPMTNTIASLNEFTGELKNKGPELIENLNKAAKDLKTLLEENRPSLKDISNKTASTMNSLQNITSAIEKGEGTLGKLLKDEKLYNSLTNAITGVEKTVAAIDRFRTFITFQAEYLSRLHEEKGYFYVTLQPRPNKYYILGVVGDPAGSISVTETTTNGTTVREEKLKAGLEFTAQFAKRFKNTVLRIGITENTFGAGADHFLLKDKLKLTSDAWDFGEDEYKAKGPHIKVGADYFLFKHVFISGGIDNLLNEKRRGVYAGAGIRFEDEDFKYIFGTVPKIPGQ